MDTTTGSPKATFPQLDGVRHRFVELPGLRMHVAEAGAGDPVLLLHGFPQHWWEWREVIPALAGRYRVICPDLRGAGWTDAPADGYNATQLLADVLALLDALEVDRVHVLAHDWAALLGFQLSLNHPERVRSFISAATPHPYVRFHPGLLLVLWRLWFQLVIIMPVLGPRLLSGGRQRFTRYLLRNFAYSPEAFTEADIGIFLAPLRQPARARAGSALYRGFIIRGVAQIAAGRYRSTQLRTPTRVLYGARDPGIKPEFLRGYEDHADDLILVNVERAAHFVIDDRPDAVVENALEFFARH
jgi:pimeloyl-ACP methyl ester carboxylesterase